MAGPAVRATNAPSRRPARGCGSRRTAGRARRSGRPAARRPPGPVAGATDTAGADRSSPHAVTHQSRRSGLLRERVVHMPSSGRSRSRTSSTTASGTRSTSCTPRAPVDALHVVREHDAANRSARRQRHLEWIPFRVAGDRARNREAGTCVIDARRQDERGPAAALLVAGLRVKREPDEIPGVRDVRARYHSSFPTAWPQSVSRCRLRGVMRSISSSRE